MQEEQEIITTQEEQGIRQSTILIVLGLIIFIISLIWLLVSANKKDETPQPQPNTNQQQVITR